LKGEIDDKDDDSGGKMGVAGMGVVNEEDSD
jgi:hypothetical protein